MNRILIFLFCLVFCNACSSTKAVNDQPNFIQFGNHGGFAGTYSEYQIFENGTAFYRTSPKSKFLAIESIEIEDAAKVFSNYKTLKIDAIIMKDAGNLTKFIKARVDGIEHAQEWGGKLVPLDDNLRLYFNALNNLIDNKHAIQ